VVEWCQKKERRKILFCCHHVQTPIPILYLEPLVWRTLVVQTRSPSVVVVSLECERRREGWSGKRKKESRREETEELVNRIENWGWTMFECSNQPMVAHHCLQTSPLFPLGTVLVLVLGLCACNILVLLVLISNLEPPPSPQTQPSGWIELKTEPRKSIHPSKPTCLVLVTLRPPTNPDDLSVGWINHRLGKESGHEPLQQLKTMISMITPSPPLMMV